MTGNEVTVEMEREFKSGKLTSTLWVRIAHVLRKRCS